MGTYWYIGQEIHGNDTKLFNIRKIVSHGFIGKIISIMTCVLVFLKLWSTFALSCPKLGWMTFVLSPFMGQQIFMCLISIRVPFTCQVAI